VIAPSQIPHLEAGIRPLRLNRRKYLQDDVDFRKPRSSFRWQADEASSSNETLRVIVKGAYS
jgi:hypothetical protein